MVLRCPLLACWSIASRVARCATGRGLVGHDRNQRYRTDLRSRPVRHTHACRIGHGRRATSLLHRDQVPMPQGLRRLLRTALERNLVGVKTFGGRLRLLTWSSWSSFLRAIRRLIRGRRLSSNSSSIFSSATNTSSEHLWFLGEN